MTVQTADIRVINEGSLVGLHPLTPTGEEWIDDHVAAPSWSWLGPVLWVDYRYADPIVTGAQDNGLSIQD